MERRGISEINSTELQLTVDVNTGEPPCWPNASKQVNLITDEMIGTCMALLARPMQPTMIIIFFGSGRLFRKSSLRIINHLLWIVPFDQNRPAIIAANLDNKITSWHLSTKPFGPRFLVRGSGLPSALIFSAQNVHLKTSMVLLGAATDRYWTQPLSKLTHSITGDERIMWFSRLGPMISRSQDTIFNTHLGPTTLTIIKPR